MVNRGGMEVGLELLLEGVQTFENIHSIIHPEVAAAYNVYSSALYQVARLKIQSMSESAESEEPLGLDIATGVRLQRQAVIIAERTLGVHSPETAAYYFQLAMLENLEGNALLSLRYFRHALTIWDVVYGPGHPEMNHILVSAYVMTRISLTNRATPASSSNRSRSMRFR
jgi:protein TIF31